MVKLSYQVQNNLEFCDVCDKSVLYYYSVCTL